MIRWRGCGSRRTYSNEGSKSPPGYVLPVQRWNAKAAGDPRRWVSEPWTTRSGRLFLLPGDSPLGFRLPLPSLSYLAPVSYPYVLAADPFVERGDLRDPPPSRQPFLRGGRARAAGSPERVQRQPGAGGYLRTALAAEPRDGRLCVFLPPVAELEVYLDLLAALEDSCAELGVAVHLEGYSIRRATRG